MSKDIQEKTFFRPFEIPSKKALKKAIEVASMNEVYSIIGKTGNYSDIIIEDYPPDKRRSYFRGGSVSWLENVVITGVRKGERVVIGFMSNKQLL